MLSLVEILRVDVRRRDTMLKGREVIVVTRRFERGCVKCVEQLDYLYE